MREEFGDNTRVYSSPGKIEGQWYHVAAVRDDAAKTIELYVNGNLEGSKSYAGKIPVSSRATSTWEAVALWGDYFNGDLDEVEIYNRALSDSEIQAIFNAGSAGKCKLPPIITVTIDIKPGSDPNSINLKEQGENTRCSSCPRGSSMLLGMVNIDSLTFGACGE